MQYNNDEKPSNRPKDRLRKGVYIGTKSKVHFLKIRRQILRASPVDNLS